MTLTIKVPPSLNVRLAAEAQRRRVSKSQLAREGIENVLAASAQRPSVYDLLKDVCSTGQGPRDLSTNPKYMEGFGNAKAT